MPAKTLQERFALLGTPTRVKTLLWRSGLVVLWEETVDCAGISQIARIGKGRKGRRQNLEFETELKVTAVAGEVLLEPGAVKGVQGQLFTVRMSPKRARVIAHELLSAAMQAERPTCKG